MRALLAFAILTLTASVAHANPGATLTTVDEFERASAAVYFSITGIPSGQSAPQTNSYTCFNDAGTGYSSLSCDACERAALMMMNRPGRFVLKINVDGNGYATCRLVKAQ